MLVGYRTYICVVVGIGVVVLNALGMIDEHVRDRLLDLIGFTSIATLRSAIAGNAEAITRK